MKIFSEVLKISSYCSIQNIFPVESLSKNNRMSDALPHQLKVTKHIKPLLS